MHTSLPVNQAPNQTKQGSKYLHPGGSCLVIHWGSAGPHSPTSPPVALKSQIHASNILRVLTCVGFSVALGSKKRGLLLPSPILPSPNSWTVLTYHHDELELCWELSLRLPSLHCSVTPVLVARKTPRETALPAPPALTPRGADRIMEERRQFRSTRLRRYMRCCKNNSNPLTCLC